MSFLMKKWILQHKFAQAALVGGHGISRGGDRAADDDVIAAQLAGALGRGHARLIAHVAAGKAHAGGTVRKDAPQAA